MAYPASLRFIMPVPGGCIALATEPLPFNPEPSLGWERYMASRKNPNPFTLAVVPHLSFRASPISCPWAKHTHFSCLAVSENDCLLGSRDCRGRSAFAM